MRLLVTGCLALLAAGSQAQLNQPVKFYQPSYAIDHIFKKTASQSMEQPSIMQRSLQTTSVCNMSCTPLPVRFLSLKAERRSEEKVVVQWETSAELNAAGYEVERSLGNATQFGKVGFVAGKGETLSAYAFNDPNDYAGMSYYRLKQVDRDGKYAYSKTVAVKGYSKEEGIEVYPNPADGVLQLSLMFEKGGLADLQVFDATGRVVHRQSAAFSKGGNVHALNIASLAPGTYYVRAVIPAGKVLTSRFIKN